MKKQIGSIAIAILAGAKALKADGRWVGMKRFQP